MARSQKFKVYCTPVGFHDAYVAATSQKAALKAWGSHADLFARGIASLVIDPALTMEPLAKPGQVILKSRGSTAEQIAALPKAKPKAKMHASEFSGAFAKTTQAKKPTPARTKRPKPSRKLFDQAQEMLDSTEVDFREKEQVLADRIAELQSELRQLKALRNQRVANLEKRRDQAEEKYRKALSRWAEQS